MSLSQTEQDKLIDAIRKRNAQALSCNQILAKHSTVFLKNVPMTALASMLAATGLMSNSATTLIAAMLVSPLGSPILRSSMGLALENYPEFWMGVRNELGYVVIAIIVGYLFGLAKFSTEKDEKGGNELPGEVTARSDWGDMWWAAGLVAILGGGVLAYSQRKLDGGLIVAIGIGAALLPPVVNAGLLWARATIPKNEKTYSREELFKKGWNSLGLWGVNYTLVLLAAWATFKYVPPFRGANRCKSARNSSFLGGLKDAASGNPSCNVCV